MMVCKRTALLVRRCCSRPKQYQGFHTSVRHYATFYDVLKIKRSATPKEIKRAYIEASKKHHPDVSSDPNAQDQFTKINTAYEVLGNPQSKLSYDSFIFNSKISTFTGGHQRHAAWEDFDMHNGDNRSGEGNHYNASEERYSSYWYHGIAVLQPLSLMLDVLCYSMIITFFIRFYIDRRKKGLNFIFPPRPLEVENTVVKRSKNISKGSTQAS